MSTDRLMTRHMPFLEGGLPGRDFIDQASQPNVMQVRTAPNGSSARMDLVLLLPRRGGG